MNKNLNRQNNLNFKFELINECESTSLSINNKLNSESLVEKEMEMVIPLEELNVIEIKKLDCTWKEVFCIKIDKINKNYLPGDSIGIIAPNSYEKVKYLFELCDWWKCYSNDNIYSIERDGLEHFKYRGTILNLFINYIDINQIPRKLVLKTLSRSAYKRKELEHFMSNKGKELYYKSLINWDGIIEIIVKFKCKPEIKDFLKICELIKPRYFSLINEINDPYEIIMEMTKNTLNKNDNTVDMLKGLSIKNEEKFPKFGQVSRHIKFDKPKKLRTIFRASKLLLPLNQVLSKDSELITYCIGTGITPLISFYRNTDILKHKVFYGYKNDEDNLFKKFLPDFKGERNYCKSNFDNLHVDDEKNILLNNYSDTKDVYILICGSIKMQIKVFNKIKIKNPEIVKNKGVFFDCWS